MAVYQKVDGVWKPAEMVHVKKNNVHVPAINAYVKVAGVWRVAHTYDVVPPDPAEISTEIIDNISGGKLVGRWIRIGIRGGPSHNPNLRRIRVLTTYNGAMPTSYLGGTYTGAADENWPGEPWSEWRYNSFGSHGDTSNFSYKQWPRNASGSVTVKAGTDYHFAAWAEDFSGNWSAGVSRAVAIPTGVNAANVVVKQTRLQANSSATLTPTGVESGDLMQAGNPMRNGIWFYGDQINASVGAQGTPTIRGAQIAVHRDEDDGGSPSANVYLFRHLYRSQGEVPPAGDRVLSEITKLGTIAKGEGKWFEIPQSMWPDLNAGLRGFGLFFRDPAKATPFANDFSVVKGVSRNIRSGEVVITWQEAL